jgi:hypothetical protein
MPGLVPGIHVFAHRWRKKDVDGRDKPGHDAERAFDHCEGWYVLGAACELCVLPRN